MTKLRCSAFRRGEGKPNALNGWLITSFACFIVVQTRRGPAGVVDTNPGTGAERRQAGRLDMAGGRTHQETRRLRENHRSARGEIQHAEKDHLGTWDYTEAKMNAGTVSVTSMTVLRCC